MNILTLITKQIIVLFQANNFFFGFHFVFDGSINIDNFFVLQKLVIEIPIVVQMYKACLSIAVKKIIKRLF